VPSTIAALRYPRAMSLRAKTVRITAFGGPEVLAPGELEVRAPGPGEVCVEVAAAGVNRADLLQRRGVYPAPPGVPADVPGLEYAGRVAAVGEGVREWKVGDAVMGIVAGGALATHLVVHAREAIAVPRGMSLTDAAALPEVFLTAYDAIVTQGGLASGDTLLVHAIGSGVGTAALQLARALGARTLGTSRTAGKLVRCEALGLAPDDGLAVTDARFAEQVQALTGGRGVDVVLDGVGAAYLEENVRALAPGGRVVVIGLLAGASAPLPLGLLLQKRARVFGSVLRSRPLEEKIALARLFSQRLLPLFERGVLRPVVDAVLPMRAAQEAHARLEAGDSFGKIVLAW
jgi:NADPH2:quinone reductase